LQLNTNIRLVFNLTLLIIANLAANNSLAQETGAVSSSGLNGPVNYQANDSIVADVKTQIIRLYGASEVTYEGIKLTAEIIEIDISKNEVTAKYGIDSLGNPIGKPVFTGDGQESKSDYIKYNFESKKGFIKEVRMQQGEGYIHMAKSKIQPNEQIHFKHGKFTTCDKEKPHYHFKLSRAIVIPEKRIVSGPVYMEILNVPLPLALPFAFFPNSETKKSGIIIPELSFNNYDAYGFGITRLGYYVPLGQYWETYFYGTIFTSGRFGIENVTNYYQKYKHRGTFGLNFEQLRGKFYTPEVSNKLTLRWIHNQDAKAHPTLKFSTNINYVSDNSAKTTLNAVNEDFYNNTFNSNINVNKSWSTKKFNGAMTLKTSLRQNTQSQNYAIELPSFNLSVSRFNLGVLRSSPIGKKWYENINVNYNVKSANTILAPDSIFNNGDLGEIGSYATNGIHQNAILQSNLSLLKGKFLFTPGLTYNEIWNFQSEQLTWNSDTEKLDTTEVNGFVSSRNMSISAQLNSNLFGYYVLKGPSKTRFRHVASPVINFSYSPDIGLHEKIQVDTNGTERFYSPFQNSLYREGSQGASGIIRFTLNNTLEMKRRNPKDSLNNEEKAIKLVDAFGINGNYDLLKDSMNLSDIRLSFRTANFFKIFSFQSDATFTPYSWDTQSGVKSSTYAWNDGNGLGRFSRASSTINANITSEKGREEQKKADKATENDANKNAQATNSKFVNYSIPWQVNILYNIDYTRASINNIDAVLTDSSRLVQTAQVNGDLSLNEMWKLRYSYAFDVQNLQTTQVTAELWRDLHCWEASLRYVQNGAFTNPEIINYSVPWSVTFHVGIKASMFQDIKYDQTISNPF
jgi:lipopolysaccharide assembly outer membrane protein LptD (OstA)